MSKAWIPLLLLCNSLCIWAKPSVFEDGNLYFSKIGQADDIPGRIVTAMAQDATGFIWIASQQGLVKYDGYRFHEYHYNANNTKSLAGDDVRSLWAAGDGSLWVGTFSEGLSMYDPATDQFRNYSYDSTAEIGLSHYHIIAVEGDNKGNLWIGTDAGLDHLDIASGAITRIPPLEGCGAPERPEVKSLKIIDETLWIGTDKGVCLLSIANWDDRTTDYRISNLPQLATNEVHQIFKGKDGKVWFGTRYEGAFWYEPNSQTINKVVYPPEINKVNAFWVVNFAQLAENELWMGTAGGGISVVDAKNGQFVRQLTHDPAVASSLRMDDIGALLLDKSGLLWIGTWGDGLNRYNPGNNAFRSLRASPNKANTISYRDTQSLLALENGDVWIGFRGEGIDVFRPGVGKIRHYQANPNDLNSIQDGFVSELLQSEDGTIWVGTRTAGLWRYQAQSDDFQHIGKESAFANLQIISIENAPNNEVWLGTDVGLLRYSPESESFTRFNQLANIKAQFEDSVWALEREENGRLWIGTASGLYFIEPSESQISEVKNSLNSGENLSNRSIISILQGQDGTVWITTMTGLDRITHWEDGQPRFDSASKRVGLGDESVWGTVIEDNQGRLWTENYLIDPNIWKSYRLLREDGWDIGNQWHGAFAKTDDGIIMMGGTEGVLLVKPEYFEPWSYEPPLVLGNLTIDGRRTTTLSNFQLELNERVKSFSVEFAALDYSAPQQNRYAYRLLGYDDNWTYTASDNRRATYTNLDPGDYYLQIRGSNKDGKWSRQEIALLITQQAKWHQAIWVNMVMVMLIGLSLFIAYRWRVASLNRHRKELDNLVKSRTRNIVWLGKIGQEITSSLNMDEVLQQVYNNVNSLMDAYGFTLGLYSKEKQAIEFKLAFEGGERLPQYTVLLTDETQPSVWCVKNQKELTTSRLKDLKNFVNTVTEPIAGEPTESMIYLPLVVDRKVIGCMSVQSRRVNAYGDNELQMLRTIANYTAIALDNADSHTKLEDTLQELETKNVELGDALEKIEQISLTDPLTGAHNRRFLEKFIQGEISQLRRDANKGINDELAFILMDVDHFKQVNDIYGHEAGDQVLKQLVMVLKGVCRETDWIIRLGGEEFLVIARIENKQQLFTLANRIRKGITRHAFVLPDGLTIYKTASMGLCGFPFIRREFELITWEQTINLADHALYAAKNNGRDAWICIYEESIQDPKSFYTQAISSLDIMLNSHQIACHSSFPPDKEWSFDDKERD